MYTQDNDNERVRLFINSDYETTIFNAHTQTHTRRIYILFFTFRNVLDTIDASSSRAIVMQDTNTHLKSPSSVTHARVY